MVTHLLIVWLLAVAPLLLSLVRNESSVFVFGWYLGRLIEDSGRGGEGRGGERRGGEGRGGEGRGGEGRGGEGGEGRGGEQTNPNLGQQLLQICEFVFTSQESLALSVDVLHLRLLYSGALKWERLCEQQD